MFVRAVAAALSLASFPTVAAPVSWTRGSYGSLQFTYDDVSAGASYSFSFGSSVYNSTAGTLANATSFAQDSGSDAALGAFDRLTATIGADGALAVAYFSRLDAYVFTRAPETKLLPASWPTFDVSAQPANSSRCVGYGRSYFFPASVGGGESLADCSSDGPLFVFEAATQALPFEPRPTMALTPLSHFTTSFVDAALLVDASAGDCEKAGGSCSLFRNSALLLARPGFARATRAAGSVLRQAWNATRRRGPGVTQLSEWNDNQGSYSWWSVGNDQMAWGAPEDIYLKQKAGYDAAGIPIRGLEPDNNFVVDYSDPKNWIGVDLGTFNSTLYPSLGPGFVEKLGIDYLVYYSNGFAANNVYAKTWSMVPARSGLEPHPANASAFYASIVRSWPTGRTPHTMHFADFLNFRGPAMRSYQSGISEDEEGEHLWLTGLMSAASETQLCMAAAHEVLVSLEVPTVTNARVNGDGGLDTPSIVLPSILTAMVGLGWSKDNLRTADRCYNAAYFPNGTIMWACDAMNKGEAVNGAFKMQVQQTALAAVSLGPVGISDQLSARPDDPAANITSNVTLVMATCSRTGDLLQPSYPATPIERMVVEAGGFGDCFGLNHRAYTFGCGTNVFATYTAAPVVVAGGGGVAIFYVALAFAYGRGELATEVTLFESDLAAMVDSAALPAPLLDEVPTGAFSGAGEAFSPDAAGSGNGHVMWISPYFAASGCGGVRSLALWNGSVAVPLPDGAGDGVTIVNVAPVFAGGVALLGEATKVVAVSTFRVASIESTGAGQVAVALRGAPGEAVELLFASGAEPQCVSCAITIAADGTATAKFPACA